MSSTRFIRTALGLGTVAAVGYAGKEVLQRKAESIVRNRASASVEHQAGKVENWREYLDERMRHALGIGSQPQQKEEKEEKQSHRLNQP